MQTTKKLIKIEWLIALLYSDNSEKIYGITRFEKLLFLYLMQNKYLEEIKSFGFEAYDYGPHSDDIRDLLYSLRDIKLIEIGTRDTKDFLNIDDVETDKSIKPIYYDKEEIYSLTEKGKDIGSRIKNKFPNFKDISTFKANFNQIELRRLIQLIYTKYPAMTEKSKILKDIFG